MAQVVGAPPGHQKVRVQFQFRAQTQGAGCGPEATHRCLSLTLMFPLCLPSSSRKSIKACPQVRIKKKRLEKEIILVVWNCFGASIFRKENLYLQLSQRLVEPLQPFHWSPNQRVQTKVLLTIPFLENFLEVQCLL